MLCEIALRYYRAALFCRHLSVHHRRHYHSYLSVKQALESESSHSDPVLIQVTCLDSSNVMYNNLKSLFEPQGAGFRFRL